MLSPGNCAKVLEKEVECTWLSSASTDPLSEFFVKSGPLVVPKEENNLYSIWIYMTVAQVKIAASQLSLALYFKKSIKYRVIWHFHCLYLPCLVCKITTHPFSLVDVPTLSPSYASCGYIGRCSPLNIPFFSGRIVPSSWKFTACTLW